jgi:hypothetical protein
LAPIRVGLQCCALGRHARSSGGRCAATVFCLVCRTSPPEPRSRSRSSFRSACASTTSCSCRPGSLYASRCTGPDCYRHGVRAGRQASRHSASSPRRREGTPGRGAEVHPATDHVDWQCQPRGRFDHAPDRGRPGRAVPRRGGKPCFPGSAVTSQRPSRSTRSARPSDRSLPASWLPCVADSGAVPRPGPWVPGAVDAQPPRNLRGPLPVSGGRDDDRPRRACSYDAQTGRLVHLARVVHQPHVMAPPSRWPLAWPRVRSRSGRTIAHCPAISCG